MVQRHQLGGGRRHNGRGQWLRPPQLRGLASPVLLFCGQGRACGRPDSLCRSRRSARCRGCSDRRAALRPPSCGRPLLRWRRGRLRCNRRLRAVALLRGDRGLGFPSPAARAPLTSPRGAGVRRLRALRASRRRCRCPRSSAVRRARPGGAGGARLGRSSCLRQPRSAGAAAAARAAARAARRRGGGGLRAGGVARRPRWAARRQAA
mmetsp:Transcript_100990/g.281322  ORF Transcript_100990/g.281322 Transcript_100990/m.281322 type:complete len:207 (-) Transcript_100990:359-979(-)